MLPFSPSFGYLDLGWACSWLNSRASSSLSIGFLFLPLLLLRCFLLSLLLLRSSRSLESQNEILVKSEGPRQLSSLSAEYWWSRFSAFRVCRTKLLYFFSIVLPPTRSVDLSFLALLLRLGRPSASALDLLIAYLSSLSIFYLSSEWSTGFANRSIMSSSMVSCLFSFLRLRLDLRRRGLLFAWFACLGGKSLFRLPPTMALPWRFICDWFRPTFWMRLIDREERTVARSEKSSLTLRLECCFLERLSFSRGSLLCGDVNIDKSCWTTGLLFSGVVPIFKPPLLCCRSKASVRTSSL